MRRLMFVAGIVALSGLAAVIARAATNAGDSEWMKDYEAARAAARESGKPMFVVIRCER